jgi:hypothetical protein
MERLPDRRGLIRNVRHWKAERVTAQPLGIATLTPEIEKTAKKKKVDNQIRPHPSTIADLQPNSNVKTIEKAYHNDETAEADVWSTTRAPFTSLISTAAATPRSSLPTKRHLRIRVTPALYRPTRSSPPTQTRPLYPCKREYHPPIDRSSITVLTFRQFRWPGRWMNKRMGDFGGHHHQHNKTVI